MAQPETYDFEVDPLNSQLAMARALRKKGLEDTGGLVSGIYVGDAGSRFMNSLAGSAMESTAHKGLGDVQRRRDEEYRRAIARRPSMMMDEVVPGAPAVTQEFPGADAFGGEGGAPVTVETSPSVLPSTRKVMKPYQQQQQEQMEWATGMGQLKHPMAQALAAQAMKEAWDIPEKGLIRQEQAEARAHELKLRADEARRLAKEKADDKKAADEAAAQREKENKEYLLRVAASLRPPKDPQQPKTVETDKGVLQWNGTAWTPIKVDGVTVLPKATAGEKKLSAAEQKRATSRSDLLAKVERAEQLLGDNPDAAGLKTLMPNLFLQYVSTPGEMMTRGASGELSAEKAHELYGAAFTAAEMARAGKFLPQDGDSVDTLKVKFQNLKDIIKATETKPVGAAKPAATGAAGVPLESGLTAAEEKRLAELKAKYGR